MSLSAAFIDQWQAGLLRDLRSFVPELILCGTIVALLLARLFASLRRLHACSLAFVAVLGALVAAGNQWEHASTGDASLFTGLLTADRFGLFVRVFLLIFLALALALTRLTGLPDRDDSADFATLLVGSALGMMLMASANHLLMVFVAIEMASVPSYALAGFLKGRRQGSEAALKYVVYGASASGVMLFGISLLAGRFGSGYLPELARGYQMAMVAGGPDAIMIAGTLFVVVGLGYKLAAAPFHFWCPDVFEGAAAEVGAFLSVASKGAALALTARILASFAGPAGSQSIILFGGSFGVLFAVIAAATTTFGNVAALGQTNLKRLLAYSTIAQAGIMMMALVPLSAVGNAAMLFYLGAYLLTNLGAFACVAFIRDLTRSEDLADLGGLVHRAPGLVIAFGIFLLSLLGLPPLAGFAAKFQVFAVLADAGRHSHEFPLLQGAYYGLLVVAAINTVLGAVYYIKALRVMVLEPAPAGAATGRVGVGAYAYLAILAGGVIALGLFWNFLVDASSQAAAGMSGLGRRPR
jgi:NADH-quinone oxidoreductase subunit N